MTMRDDRHSDSRANGGLTRSQRRLMLSVLRQAHRVLGMKRRRAGVGALGVAGGATARVAVGVIGLAAAATLGGPVAIGPAMATNVTCGTGVAGSANDKGTRPTASP